MKLLRTRLRRTKVELEGGGEAIGPERLLIAGLRNPGAKYDGSRHNVGAEVVDTIANRSGIGFKRARQSIRAEVAELRLGDVPVVLAKPTCFMNESGQAVKPLLRYFSVPVGRLVVVHDDIDLLFSRLRIQFDRGAGGNNGVRSVVDTLGTRAFWRLKCGVGRPPGSMDPADYVLRRFSAKERPDVDLMVQYGADVLEVFAAAGGEAAAQAAGEAGVAG